MQMTIANCETGEITVVPLSDEHLTSLKEASAQEEAERTQREAEAEQRRTDADALLAALPAESRGAAKRLLNL